jgi:LETM1 and EF-hand domain-containing protein 1
VYQTTLERQAQTNLMPFSSNLWSSTASATRSQSLWTDAASVGVQHMRALTQTSLRHRGIGVGGVLTSPNKQLYFHSMAWQMQQQVQEKGVVSPPMPTTPPPVTTSHHHHHPAHIEPKVAMAPMLTEYADAEECDEAMEDLEQTRQRVKRLSRPPPGHVPLSMRIKQLSSAALRGIQVAFQFLLSVPGKLGRFAALPRAERKAIYAGWWVVIKKEAKHYWLGTKLLGKDVKIASRLVSKVLSGRTLSRRERQQLTRTTADIFRLVPMMVFIVIPFMELLLPVALKLFPNMLPSTFEDKLKKEEDMKRKVGARIEVARFLQDTVTEMASDMRAHASSGETQTSAAELYEFMKRVRAGETVAPSELLKFAKLFNDELTLDNLERVQLASLCRFVGIQPFGTDAFLRARLRLHLKEIKEDDREIKEEGLDTLTEDELRQACRARGMRAPFGEGAVAFMKEQLEEWLDWSLNRSLPSSLLLLSRAFTVTAPMGAGQKGRGAPAVADVTSLRETLSSLPDEAVEDVELFSTPQEADDIHGYERKLDILEREEEMIKEEEEAAAVAVASELPITAGKATAQELAATAAAAAVVREAAASSFADLLEGESQEERAAKEAVAKEERMRQVLRALAALSSSSGVTTEREAFMDLVEKEIDRLNETLGSTGRARMVFTKGHLAVDRERLEQALGQKRLEERVSGILKRVEKELDDADQKIGSKLRVLDMDNDGVISMEELHTAMTFLRQQMGEEELRAMLEALNAESGAVTGADGKGGIDVCKLMDLALKQPGDKDEI